MLRFLTLIVVVAAASAWDPSLKIAEKIAIPHHKRHTYDYPYINLAQITGQVNRNIRQGFSQLEPNRPQRQAFQQSSPVQPNRGFQSQPLSSGFQSQPLSSGFQSQPLSSGFQSRPVSSGFQRGPVSSAFQSRPLSSGFQSQPFEPSSGFRNPSAQQTSFFELGTARSGSPFNRRQL